MLNVENFKRFNDTFGHGACDTMFNSMAKHLRRQVKQSRVQYESRVLGQITLSLGVAGFPPHGSSSQSLLQAAGSAHYEAKHDGHALVAVAPAI